MFTLPLPRSVSGLPQVRRRPLPLWPSPLAPQLPEVTADVRDDLQRWAVGAAGTLNWSGGRHRRRVARSAGPGGRLRRQGGALSWIGPAGLVASWKLLQDADASRDDAIGECDEMEMVPNFSLRTANKQADVWIGRAIYLTSCLSRFSALIL